MSIGSLHGKYREYAGAPHEEDGFVFAASYGLCWAASGRGKCHFLADYHPQKWRFPNPESTQRLRNSGENKTILLMLHSRLARCLLRAL